MPGLAIAYWQEEKKARVSYQTGLHQLCVDVSIFRYALNLKNNLNDGAGEVLDEDDLRKRGLQDGFQMALSCSYKEKRSR